MFILTIHCNTIRRNNAQSCDCHLDHFYRDPWNADAV